MKNIVLLGGSNSVMVNGIQKVLSKEAKLINLALGGCAALQNLVFGRRIKHWSLQRFISDFARIMGLTL
ncbi:hypothetical protein [Helicobacter sp. MIT 05-5294]|uniref:hypothetical protein n=1 Tax=Helicobacter sp. MIT 05-5294 TaxID=1548150 RepID=UPI00051F94B5|nr:hypothetical protein [Helicobacter sp. MIT 05-5294]TLD89265.1 hypothetical protein LS69_001175 [Helicobacter sp. MIT 05-5294]